MTPVMSFCIRNQDPLLTDIHLLQETFWKQYFYEVFTFNHCIKNKNIQSITSTWIVL